MLEAFRDAPVFMLTSNEKPEHITRAFDLKIQSYFMKPSTVDELQSLIEGILASWQGRSRYLSGNVIDPSVA